MPDGRGPFNLPETPRPWSWRERYPFIGHLSQPLASKATLRYGYAEMPFIPWSYKNWASGEPGELRFLGYSDRPRFEATLKGLPFIAKGWKTIGVRRYGEWSGGREKEQGYYLEDPLGDVWSLALSNRGAVHLENLSERLPMYPKRKKPIV